MAQVWLPLALLHEFAKDYCNGRIWVVSGIVMAEINRILRQRGFKEFSKVNMGTYIRCFILDERRKHVALQTSVTQQSTQIDIVLSHSFNARWMAVVIWKITGVKVAEPLNLERIGYVCKSFWRLRRRLRIVIGDVRAIY